MSRIISRAESYETIETAISQINFTSFDFYTIKNSLIDYVKLHNPENFNDFIESSEFISILEIFSYVLELYNYRLDINASENFLSTAKRKQSVLKLSKFLSYNVSRNIPGRGLVKLQSIKSTEDVFDSDGINLNGRTIIWNDPNNVKWKDQFILVMNRIMKQEFGTVFPTDRVQIDNVIFELYELENIPINNGVIPYSTTVSGEQVPMELVPVELNDLGPLERRPDRNDTFSILYGSDGLGDSSDTTGFFIFTKQGELRSQRETFDGITPNQTFSLDEANINNTDIWINNIDPTTQEVLNDNTITGVKSGEWHEVDISHAQNIIFNTNPNRNKFEIETLEDDKVKIIFGDGEFADIPSGVFDLWFRSSINKALTIPKNAISSLTSTFNFIGRDSNSNTFTFTYSLINSIQNNSVSEDIEHIRKTAPSVYYTQDRMVNGKDYNTFMLQDTSILKLRSINRTFIGDSKYISWHDPKEYYESVKLFGDDLAIYFEDNARQTTIYNESESTNVFYNNIEPILASNDFFTIMTSNNVLPNDIRTKFTQTEASNMIQALELAMLSPPQTIQLFYSFIDDEWIHMTDESGPVSIPNTSSPNVFTSDFTFSTPIISSNKDQVLFNVSSVWDGTSLTAEGMITIIIDGTNWTILNNTRKIITQSTDTRFWNSNDNSPILSFDTLISNRDEIIILDANKHSNRESLLSENKHFDIINQELVESILPTSGLIDIHKLNVLPIDINGDTIPDNMDLAELFNISNITIQNSIYTLPFPSLFQDISLSGITTGITYEINGSYVSSPNNDDIITKIQEINNNPVIIDITEYIYFQREEIDLDTGEFTWIPKNTNSTIISSYINRNDHQPQWKRENGRYPFNFLWMHRSPRLNLIDPAATNIIDTYIISRSYYNSVLEWLSDKSNILPEESTSLQLRTDYNHLLESKMISDTMILHSGKIKILFGNKAIDELQSTFKIIRKDTSRLTDNQIKTKLINIVKDFFDIELWSFGESFFMSELTSNIHVGMISDIKSVVLVPTHTNNLFGDLYVIPAREDEIFQPHITVDNIEIVTTFSPENINQNR